MKLLRALREALAEIRVSYHATRHEGKSFAQGRSEFLERQSQRNERPKTRS